MTKKVAAVGTREVDIRMLVQLSAFTIHTTPDALDATPGAPDYLVKYEIPADKKKRLLHQLRLMGMIDAVPRPREPGARTQRAADVLIARGAPNPCRSGRRGDDRPTSLPPFLPPPVTRVTTPELEHLPNLW
ncbi:MAG TPA: hypothetical protein VJQ53_09475 [Candidatus Eisenbacteria bacterium]|nr:hypothetical protein [Candidatus Eisenbacteria bacterium]